MYIQRWLWNEVKCHFLVLVPNFRQKISLQRNRNVSKNYFLDPMLFSISVHPTKIMYESFKGYRLIFLFSQIDNVRCNKKFTNLSCFHLLAHELQLNFIFVVSILHWASDCCLMSSEQFFGYILVIISRWDDDDVCFVPEECA